MNSFSSPIKKYAVIGFVFVSLLGTILHFAYDLTGNNPIVGMFCPINESIWEHMKLLFFPAIIFLFLSFRTLNQLLPHVCSSYAFGILVGLFFIPVLFYSYSGIIGHSILVVDISIFYICVALLFYIFCKYSTPSYSNSKPFYKKGKWLWYTLIFLLFFAFIYFTFRPPHIGLFADPQAQTHNPSASN